jgi:hypothetical protein
MFSKITDNLIRKDLIRDFKGFWAVFEFQINFKLSFMSLDTLSDEQKRQPPTWVCGKRGLTEVIEHQEFFYTFVSADGNLLNICK